jgi:hypothetical protein
VHVRVSRDKSLESATGGPGRAVGPALATYNRSRGAIAQLGERPVCIREVAGSNPAGSTSTSSPRARSARGENQPAEAFKGPWARHCFGRWIERYGSSPPGSMELCHAPSSSTWDTAPTRSNTASTAVASTAFTSASTPCGGRSSRSKAARSPRCSAAGRPPCLVVETDGLRYHRTPAQQARDRLRDQIHTAAGLTPLRFTHAQVTFEPQYVRTMLIEVTNLLDGRANTTR